MSSPVLQSLGKRVFVVLLAAALTISGMSVASAKTSSGADVAIKLGAVGAVLLAGARYTVTVTNNGPEPLTSATVTVRVDPRAYTTTVDPLCPFDAATTTFTCTFGAVPPGGAAILNPFVYFSVHTERATFEATATRVASNPADPNAANDSDPATCWYRRPQFGQTWPPPTACTFE